LRVFLAGATGVVGRRLLPRLVADGHEVTGMTRTTAKAEEIRAAGAEPAVADALDAGAVRDAVAAARPEAVVQHLTDLPTRFNPRKLKRAFAANDRLRAVGTPNLVTAATGAGARRFVAQTIAFVYAAEGGPVKSEEDPLYLEAPAPFDRSVAACETLERSVTGAEGLAGVVLRFGFWYGPGTGYARDGAIAEFVRKRRFPIAGGGEGVSSFVHVDDVVEATIAALTGAPPGIYNVVDDEPAPLREWLPAYADALGAPSPRRVPAWLVSLLGGRYLRYSATEQRGASNAKARRELGWSPRYPSWREGFREALG
jgi:nucleoside-diphosphate-sugar epimerase